jgi:hypothetical protein
VDWVEEMLVTGPTRMVGDLCAQSIDGEHLAGVVADVLHKRLANRRILVAALAPHAHRYGSEPGNGRRFLDYLLSLAPAVRP